MELKVIDKNIDKSCNYCGKICEGRWVKSRVCEQCGKQIVEESDLEGTPGAVVWAEHIRLEVKPYLTEMVSFLESKAVDEEDLVVSQADMPYIQSVFEATMADKSASSWIEKFRYPNKKKVLDHLVFSALKRKMKRYWRWDKDRTTMSSR